MRDLAASETQNSRSKVSRGRSGSAAQVLKTSRVIDIVIGAYHPYNACNTVRILALFDENSNWLEGYKAILIAHQSDRSIVDAFRTIAPKHKQYHDTWIKQYLDYMHEEQVPPSI